MISAAHPIPSQHSVCVNAPLELIAVNAIRICIYVAESLESMFTHVLSVRLSVCGDVAMLPVPDRQTIIYCRRDRRLNTSTKLPSSSLVAAPGPAIPR